MSDSPDPQAPGTNHYITTVRKKKKKKKVLLLILEKKETSFWRFVLFAWLHQEHSLRAHVWANSLITLAVPLSGKSKSRWGQEFLAGIRHGWVLLFLDFWRNLLSTPPTLSLPFKLAVSRNCEKISASWLRWAEWQRGSLPLMKMARGAVVRGMTRGEPANNE